MMSSQLTRVWEQLMNRLDNRNHQILRSQAKMLGVIEHLQQRQQALLEEMRQTRSQTIDKQIQQQLSREQRAVSRVLERARRQHARLVQAETAAKRRGKTGALASPVLPTSKSGTL